VIRRDKTGIPRMRLVVVVALVVTLVEVLGFAAPSVAAPGALRASISDSGKSSASIRVVDPTHQPMEVTAFPVSISSPVRTVLFYRSTDRPDSGSEDAIVLGTLQMLTDRLATADPRVAIRVVDAQGLARALARQARPRSVLLVDVSGTLPNTVWGPGGSGILQPWLERGGLLAFAGDVPGYYAVARGSAIGVVRDGRLSLARGVETVGVSQLLPPGVIAGPDDWTRVPLQQQSSWAEDLGLSYASDELDLSSTAVRGVQGEVLGTTGHGRTSEGFVPVGLGGVLVFAGQTVPPGSDTGPIATDLVHLIAADWFADQGLPASSSTGGRTVSLHVPLAAETTAIEIIAFNRSIESDWLWTKELAWPHR
jgi:hypothetical protein